MLVILELQAIQDTGKTAGIDLSDLLEQFLRHPKL